MWKLSLRSWNEVSELSFAKVPQKCTKLKSLRVMSVVDGGESARWGRGQALLPVPFALVGSSGTMAVKISDTGETGRQAGDFSPGKESVK